MDFEVAKNMMGGNYSFMMIFSWISWIILVVLAILGILALIKYLK